jgi:hypothetical protein
MKAVVLDGDVIEGTGHKVLREFVGTDAEQQAAAFIDTLPDHDRGRYWLDACIPVEDAHCDDCGCSK